jgi:cytoskeletal protein CcmA (bactofilin family)
MSKRLHYYSMKEIQYSPRKESVIGASSHITGKLRFESSLRIKGQFDGEITKGGDLTIEEQSIVKANLHLKNLFLYGTLHGSTVAESAVYIHDKSQVAGNITTKVISIASGAKMKGKVSMLSGNSDAVDIFSASPLQLKAQLLK